METEKNTYVIVRLSSLGNVAMLVPIVTQLSQTYPNDEFIVIALKPLEALFYGLKNVRYVEASPEVEHRRGLYRLSKQIESLKPTKVFDVQDDFRTWFVRCLLHMHKIPTCTIHSGKRERRALSRTGYEQANPLKPEVER